MNANYASPNMFMPSSALQTGFYGFEGLNTCRSSVNYYPSSAYGYNAFYPFLNGIGHPMNYPMYCMSYPPMVALDIYQRQ
jgi:hypothetical protein